MEQDSPLAPEHEEQPKVKRAPKKMNSIKPGVSYDVNELMSAAQSRFKTQPEVIGAAMSFYGVSKATIDEATVIINKFLKKEVI